MKTYLHLISRRLISLISDGIRMFLTLASHTMSLDPQFTSPRYNLYPFGRTLRVLRAYQFGLFFEKSEK